MFFVLRWNTHEIPKFMPATIHDDKLIMVFGDALLQTKQFWVYTCHHQISAAINYTDGFSWLLLRYITQHRGYDQKQRKHVLLGYAGIQLESNILEGQKRRIQTCCQISSRLGCSRQTKICTDIVGDSYSLRVSAVDLIFDRAMNHGNTWHCI